MFKNNKNIFLENIKNYLKYIIKYNLITFY